MLKPCDRGGFFKPFNVMDNNGPDQSRTKIYRYNSLGYRGEEYDPAAAFRIFTFGCSNTFVTGLNWEEGFPYRFKERVAEHFGYQVSELNLMNFSAGGHSNDYSVRTMLRQCEDESPDLILFDPSPINRIEYVNEGGYGEFFCPGRTSQTQKSLEYYDFYTETMGFVNFVKNLLFVQWYCQARSLSYLFHIRWCDIDRFRSNRTCLDYIEQLDFSRICSSRDIAKVDDAADRIYNENGDLIWSHDGPVTNKLIADRLYHFACEQGLLPRQAAKVVAHS
ncbi:MAG: hypothetical protein KDD62_10420 [Bdellovibrionales bacterium]|nr:hypothetical protein [Bdellovibrionales bacterium]